MSDNIFTELYNRVLSLFGQTPEPKEESKNTAVNRLRLVLMQDRTNLTPEIMQRMRRELIELLSKYVELDKDELELNFEQEGEQMALMLSIPVIRAKEEEEINAILKAEDEAREKAKDEDTSEEESSEEEIEEDDNEEASDEAEESEEEKDEETDDVKEEKSEEEKTEAEKISEDETSKEEEKKPESKPKTKKKKAEEKSSEE